MPLFRLRVLIILLCIFGLAAVEAASAKTEPFLELAALPDNAHFAYEQIRIPPDLRKFFIPLSLAREEVAAPTQWCLRIEELLKGVSFPTNVHYVARSYAPLTYAEVGLMSSKMSIGTPLVFITRGNNAQVKTIEARLLAGGFHALVCNISFLERHTTEEVRAIAARELASIARKHVNKKHMARKIWYGLVGGIVTLWVGFHLSTKKSDILNKISSWVREYLKSTLVGIGLLTASNFGAEIADAYFGRKYQHESDLFALRAFGGAPQQYLDCLKNIEVDEAAYLQRVQFQYKSYYAYVMGRIGELEGAVHPYLTCFLRNALSAHHTTQAEMPAARERAGILDFQSSLAERIAYIRDHMGDLSDSDDRTRP